MKTRFVPSVCAYCGTGCGVLYHVEDNRIAAVLPDPSYPVNAGGLCIKGWNSHEHLSSPKRLRTPRIQEGGTSRSVSWDEALDTVATRLQKIRETYGPDSVGMLVSARATNEDNYLAQKFVRVVLGTNNVDHCARL